MVNNGSSNSDIIMIKTIIIIITLIVTEMEVTVITLINVT